ncbi:MFS transporter [Actinospica durhamensis]|uniref:MFS transporter n=1 Tax=Actinospica durhamensis TaxID=1508375 RepID=A0A941EXT5_9ACTN|nr:MFS transporter [Actinospica durhamensis]MBR7838986.1 MFS transporter [Actinospica durhamensis]
MRTPPRGGYARGALSSWFMGRRTGTSSEEVDPAVGKRAWLLLMGSLISAVGDRFAAIAYALFAVAVHSPGLLSAVFAAELIPPLLFGLIGGVVTDKFLRRWLWPAVLALQAVCFLGMSRTQAPWAIVALVATSSSLAALIGPVGTVLLRLVTDASRHTNVARWSGICDGFAAVGGTVAAAATFQASATHVLFLVDAASFVGLAALGAVAMRGLTLPRPARGTSVRPADALVGFARLTSPRAFGGPGTAMLVGVMFGTSLEGIVGVFFLRDVMRVAPTMYGVVIGSWSVGMLLGPALFRFRAHLQGATWWRFMPTCALAMGACIAVPAVLVDQWATIAAFVLGGAANGLFNVGITSAIFRGVDQDEQGRAWSAFGILGGTCALLGYLTGAAFGSTHARLTMLASGALPAAVGILALVSGPRELRGGRGLRGLRGRGLRGGAHLAEPVTGSHSPAPSADAAAATTTAPSSGPAAV